MNYEIESMATKIYDIITEDDKLLCIPITETARHNTMNDLIKALTKLDNSTNPEDTTLYDAIAQIIENF